jgi:hypothetical protein
MVLKGKAEGKKQFVRRRRGWIDNIKMDLKEIRPRGGGGPLY